MLADRGSERRPNPVGGERRKVVVIGGVVLDHDQPALGGGPAAGAEPEAGCCSSSATISSLTPAEATRISCPGSSGSINRRPTVSSPSRSLGAGDDCLEHLVELPAADDRALDLRQPLQQPLALGQRLDQARVLRPSGARSARAAARSAPTTLSRRTVLGQYPGHAAGEVALLGGEGEFVATGQDQGARSARRRSAWRSAWHWPMPGTSSRSLSPRRTRLIASNGISETPKPLASTTRSPERSRRLGVDASSRSGSRRGQRPDVVGRRMAARNRSAAARPA